MLLQKCPFKDCGAKITLLAYLGKDELKRDVALIVCSKGHQSAAPFTVPIDEADGVFTPSELFPPPKGQWFRTPGDSKILVGCPGCGSSGPVAEPIHHIESDGAVVPSWTCPYGCGYHQFIRLKDL
jgi:hypothetical protein